MPTTTRPWFDRIKPAAPMRAHLLVAALMWTIVGVGLVGFGTWWALGRGLFPGLWLVLLAVALGVLKARLTIDKAARRIVDRIRSRGEDRCLGGFLSPGAWLLVAVMMTVGRVLRSGLLPMRVVGPIYVLVGVALLVASRGPWQAWMDCAMLTKDFPTPD